MLNNEQMKQQAEKYQLYFDEIQEQVFLLKPKGHVRITTQRAIEWVNVGIDDLDCRSKERMLELLNSWK